MPSFPDPCGFNRLVVSSPSSAGVCSAEVSTTEAERGGAECIPLPGLTLTVVEWVCRGLVAGLEGPRCLRCCRMSWKFARTGTAVLKKWPSKPAELLRIISVAVFGLLDSTDESKPVVPAVWVALWVSWVTLSLSKLTRSALPLGSSDSLRWTRALGAGVRRRIALCTSM
ncbi:hypothetical protein VTI74DRAFT_9283 [Chaetomium olivicolor]